MDSKKYNNTKLFIGITKGIVSFILLFMFVLLGYSFRLEEFIRSYTQDNYFVFILYVFAIGVISSVLFAPVNFYTGFYLEH